MATITIPRQVGQVVCAARKARGMTQAELAHDAGISRQLVNRLEMGDANNISLGRVLDVLSALGCTMSIDWDGDADEQRPVERAEHTAPSSLAWEYAGQWRLDESLFSPRAGGRDEQ
ncbi:MAG: helix-turn-helix domain-containing protein [Coriobacteriales bacterium]|nr:helix-turn-helix domain-containing protein [Coriobacteriales bacterium]